MRRRHPATRTIAQIAAASALLGGIAAANAYPEEQRAPCANNCATLLAVEIEGAHALPMRDFAADYTTYLAKPVSQAELVLIADAITQRYRRNGYFLSRAIVPAQDLSAGIAHIVIVEGAISDVSVDGPAADAVRQIFRDWDTSGPAKLADLDHRLTLAADLPGVSVQTQIEPNVDDAGKHRLVIRTRRDRVSGYVTADNRGDHAAGPWQAYAHANVAGVFSNRDELNLGLFTTPGDTNEFRSAELAYGYFLPSGARMWGSANVSRAQDGPNGHAPTPGGDGQVLSLGIDYPLMRQRRQSLWLGARFDATDLSYDWANGGGYTDVLRVARLSLRGFLGDNGHATNVFVETSLGLNALGASQASVTRRSRYNADASFGKVFVRASHYADIGERFGVYAEVAGQMTAEPLLFSEQFSLGGGRGRGYGYGELTGDSGIGGTLEGRFGFDPASPLISFLQTYAFTDAGVVRYEGQNGRSASLASAGVGMRTTFVNRYTVRVEGARPLTRTPEGDDGKDWRYYLGLAASF